MHVRYCIQGAHEAGVYTHPQRQMAALGATYTHATPQSMGGQWWFWNCDVPLPLPTYISPLNVDPTNAVGFGLSPAEADEIRAGGSC